MGTLYGNKADPVAGSPDSEKAAKRLRIPELLLKAALIYAGAFPEEMAADHSFIPVCFCTARDGLANVLRCC